jgi:hypothetical protein
MMFRMYSPFRLAAALAKFFPGGNTGFDRAHVAVTPMAGAADCADDHVIDDQRISAGDKL